MAAYASRLTVLIRVRQQRQKARTLDGGSELTLVFGFGAGDAAWHNFAALAHEGLQQVEIFVIDLGDAFSGKTAISSATKIT